MRVSGNNNIISRRLATIANRKIQLRGSTISTYTLIRWRSNGWRGVYGKVNLLGIVGV
ncbi:MAG: hypothetical protein AB1777_03955 [Bacteroidota bacterium]